MRDAVLKVSVVLSGACLTVGFILALRAATQAPEIDGPVSTAIEKVNDDANPDAVSPENAMESFLKKIPVKPPVLQKKPPVLHKTEFVCEFDCGKIFVTDSPSTKQIVYRSVPNMPENAERSGHCTFDLDVGIDGRVSNVSNLKCSDKIFEQSSKSSAYKWMFNPSVVQGKFKNFKVENLKITYRLLDEQGNLIPE